MFQDDQDIARSIEDGSYFQQARAWYSSVYMSLISERHFFIILTALAVLTSLVALTAVLRLMPLNPRAPFLYQSQDAYHLIPIIRPIKTYRSQDINDAMRRFFIVEYVERRESYASSKVDERINFIRSQSDRPTYERFSRYMDTGNPASPIQQLGNFGYKIATAHQQTVEVRPVEGRPGDYEASVIFSVQLYDQKRVDTTNHRADITFSYKDLIVDQSDDIEEDVPFKVTPMEFLVTDYRVSPVR